MFQTTNQINMLFLGENVTISLLSNPNLFVKFWGVLLDDNLRQQRRNLRVVAERYRLQVAAQPFATKFHMRLLGVFSMISCRISFFDILPQHLSLSSYPPIYIPLYHHFQLVKTPPFFSPPRSTQISPRQNDVQHQDRRRRSQHRLGHLGRIGPSICSKWYICENGI